MDTSSTSTHTPHERYFLHAEGTPWSEVERTAFLRAERAAGFRPKSGEPDELATSGFSGHGVSGRIVHPRHLTPSSYSWDPEFNAVLFPEHASA